MNLKYMEVPSNILTGKDLDYLSDMFNWNYEAVKKTNESIGSVSDENIAALLEKGLSLFQNNLDSVLDILDEIGGSNNG